MISDNLKSEVAPLMHDGAIPESEVWVKFGGDKGGGSVKLNFQMVNVPHPNSVNNT